MRWIESGEGWMLSIDVEYERFVTSPDLEGFQG